MRESDEGAVGKGKRKGFSALCVDQTPCVPIYIIHTLENISSCVDIQASNVCVGICVYVGGEGMRSTNLLARAPA